MKTYAEPHKQASHFSQSTYAMVLRAQDRRRNILENAVYFFLMLSVVAALVPLADPIGSAVKNSTSRTPIVATTTSLSLN
jgi:hypothetical protein